MNNISDILLFKTNIGTQADVHIIAQVLNNHPKISNWSMDVDDADHVLRIISAELSHTTVIDMIRSNGYHCEELKD